MLAKAAINHSSPALWVLIADSEKAKIYLYSKAERLMPLSGTTKAHYFQEKETHELVPVSGGVLRAETIDDYQIGHQRRGTTVNSVDVRHNTYEPTGDTAHELKKRFAKSIAGRLDYFYTLHAFDRLVIAAPAKMIGELRDHLSPALQARIASVLPKDLTAYDGDILLDHLQDTLTEAQAWRLS